MCHLYTVCWADPIHQCVQLQNIVHIVNVDTKGTADKTDKVHPWNKKVPKQFPLLLPLMQHLHLVVCFFA